MSQSRREGFAKDSSITAYISSVDKEINGHLTKWEVESKVCYCPSILPKRQEHWKGSDSEKTTFFANIFFHSDWHYFILTWLSWGYVSLQSSEPFSSPQSSKSPLSVKSSISTPSTPTKSTVKCRFSIFEYVLKRPLLTLVYFSVTLFQMYVLFLTAYFHDMFAAWHVPIHWI